MSHDHATLKVTLDLGYGEQETFCTNITHPYDTEYRPMDICDEPLSILFSRGNAKTTDKARIVMKMRADIADRLSKEITAQIVSALSARDTFNGYPIERDEPTSSPAAPRRQ